MDNIQKKILITSGRSPVALELARQFNYAGHTVLVTDTMRFPVCRFSNAVSKSLYAPSPRLEPEKFIERLLQIVEEEKVDLIVPVYEEIVYLAKAKKLFPPFCTLFAPSYTLLNELHNKWLFNGKIAQMGKPAPQTFLINNRTDLQQLNRSLTYALKPCYSRASLNLTKLTPTTALPKIDVSLQKPWVAQEWLEGEQYCSYGVCVDGKLLAHAVYPVGYTADGKGCIIFKSIHHPAILEWIQSFVKEVGFTGQIAFDFIQPSNGKVYAIECNPRATSGVFLFDKTLGLDQAFFNRIDSPIFPVEGASRQFMIAMLMYGWQKSSLPNNTFKKFFGELSSLPDVIFQRKDPLPMLLQPIILMEMWYNSLSSDLSLPAYFMFDYEWNGEMLR